MAVQHIPLTPDQLASAGSPAGSCQNRYRDQGPLPGHVRVDLSSVKLLRVPDVAPPFDGEVLPARAGATPRPPAAAPSPGTVLPAGPPVTEIDGAAARADAPDTEIGAEVPRQ